MRHTKKQKFIFDIKREISSVTNVFYIALQAKVLSKGNKHKNMEQLSTQTPEHSH